MVAESASGTTGTMANGEQTEHRVRPTISGRSLSHAPLEDLCQKPAETVTRLLEFLGAPEMNVGPLIEGIRDRGNIGRWREAGAKAMELNRNVRADLEQFGYKV